MRQAAAILLLALPLTAGCGKFAMWPTGDAAAAQGDEATCTVLLTVLANPATHKADAEYYKSQTEQSTGWKGLFVENKPDRSELYWGRYATYEDAAENLKKAKDYRSPVDIAAFEKAVIMPLPGPDIGPAEWKLRNSGGSYTVVVAVFYDVPEDKYYGRKKNAVAYCRQLRDQGEDAYYDHGVARSAVTIGSFGSDAVAMVTEDGVRHPEIRSGGMIAIQSRFPFLAVNGYQQLEWLVNKETGQHEKKPSPTYPAHIPKQRGDWSDATHRVGNPQLR